MLISINFEIATLIDIGSFTTIAALIVMGSFTTIALYKVVEAAKKKTSVLEFAGQIAVTEDEISADKEGFVRFHGEHWKALSKTAVAPKQKVKIISQEGLTLMVEPLKKPNT